MKGMYIYFIFLIMIGLLVVSCGQKQAPGKQVSTLQQNQDDQIQQEIEKNKQIIADLKKELAETLKDKETQKKAVVKEEEEFEDKVPDQGDFKVTYAPTNNPYYIELEQWLKKENVFEYLVLDMNEFLSLPEDINIIITECGEENAFYDPDTKEIVMCYELIEHFEDQFFQYVENEGELKIVVLDNIYFTFFHEMGHALIDVMFLPITGKEEDAVDQLATWIHIISEEEEVALSASEAFLLEGEERNVDEIAFWDEHSLDEQRYYNIACWIYGSNTEKFSYLIDEDYLPIERAERCEEEFWQLNDGWEFLLYPYIKE